MGLRLSWRNKATYPWLRNIVAFSPASTWGESWSRSFDAAKYEPVRVTGDRYREYTETHETKLAYFIAAFTSASSFGETLAGWTFPPQRERWYRADWPCRVTSMKAAILDRWEVYNTRYRLWHWRVAHEQLIFQHFEPSTSRGGVGHEVRAESDYQRWTSHLLLVAATEDNTRPEMLYSNTRALAVLARDYHRGKPRPRLTGRTLWFEHTGHSIQSERPRHLARYIALFLSHALN
jgi:pimeloyl-ACP methyl ester carboxylesterase